MKDFSEKTVYVVGGSSGIGLATANLLSAKGAHVIIFARRKDRLERALEEISRNAISKQQRFSCMPMDVSVRDEVEAVMSRAVPEFGVPDVLINCAGRAYPHYFEDITYKQFDETMKINLYGVWNTVSTLVPYMKKQGGYVVNTSSMGGLIGIFGFADYCASKFAVIGFSEALRGELKPYGITVSVLCPPDTDTPGFEVENRTKPEETKAVSANTKLRQPDEVARALIKGMRKKKLLIVPGFDGKFTFTAKRLFPALVEFITDRDVRKVQAKNREEEQASASTWNRRTT